MSELLKTLYILVLKYKHRATVVRTNGNEYTILVREVAHSKKGSTHQIEMTPRRMRIIDQPVRIFGHHRI